MSTEQDRKAAKEKLKDVLATYGGNTKHEAVITAINQLVNLNPTVAPTRNEALLTGLWLLISAPNFPNGELQPDGKYVYTLGRLAFNMFQPVKLKVAIERVLHPIIPLDNGQHTHDIIVEFITVDENAPQIKGIVRNLAISEPTDDHILQVKFTGATLTPQNQNQMKAWKAIFGEQSKPDKTNLKEKLMNKILRIMFGIVPPQGMDLKTGEVSFKMKKSPKGNIKFIYLDEELQITKGEKGMILICERVIQ